MFVCIFWCSTIPEVAAQGDGTCYQNIDFGTFFNTTQSYARVMAPDVSLFDITASFTASITFKGGSRTGVLLAAWKNETHYLLVTLSEGKVKQPGTINHREGYFRIIHISFHLFESDSFKKYREVQNTITKYGQRNINEYAQTQTPVCLCGPMEPNEIHAKGHHTSLLISGGSFPAHKYWWSAQHSPVQQPTQWLCSVRWPAPHTVCGHHRQWNSSQGQLRQLILYSSPLYFVVYSFMIQGKYWSFGTCTLLIKPGAS